MREAAQLRTPRAPSPRPHQAGCEHINGGQSTGEVGDPASSPQTFKANGCPPPAHQRREPPRVFGFSWVSSPALWPAEPALPGSSGSCPPAVHRGFPLPWGARQPEPEARVRPRSPWSGWGRACHVSFPTAPLPHWLPGASGMKFVHVVLPQDSPSLKPGCMPAVAVEHRRMRVLRAGVQGLWGMTPSTRRNH